MSQDEVERILPGWQAVSDGVAHELAEWRVAHPKATLSEIEDAVFEAMQKAASAGLGRSGSGEFCDGCRRSAAG